MMTYFIDWEFKSKYLMKFLNYLMLSGIVTVSCKYNSPFCWKKNHKKKSAKIYFFCQLGIFFLVYVYSKNCPDVTIWDTENIQQACVAEKKYCKILQKVSKGRGQCYPFRVSHLLWNLASVSVALLLRHFNTQSSGFLTHWLLGNLNEILGT